MTIDAHAHAFPTEQEGRKFQAYVGIDSPKRTGAIDELGALLSDGGLQQAIVLLIPRTAELAQDLADADLPQDQIVEEVRSAIENHNAWGCGLGESDARFIPFIGIDVRFMSESQVRSEIARRAATGARGVKIIPPSMQLYANDELLAPIYEECSRLGLPLLSQSGRGGKEPPSPSMDPFGRPRYFADVLEQYPDLTLILAHMALGFEEELVALTARFENVFTDTSLRFSGLGKPEQWTTEELVRTIRRIGVERVLLGSNYPFTNPSVYARILAELPIGEDERQMIGGDNLKAALSRPSGG